MITELSFNIITSFGTIGIITNTCEPLKFHGLIIGTEIPMKFFSWVWNFHEKRRP